MSIQSVQEFLDLGKSLHRKLPAAPTTFTIQDTVVLELYMELRKLTEEMSKWRKWNEGNISPTKASILAFRRRISGDY